MSQRGQNILIAGSHEEWHARIEHQLPNASVRVIARGADALRAARNEPPDLVIIEMVLEDMMGIGLCRGLREDPELHRVPVIVVSPQASEVDRVLAFECGADDFVPAPFSGRELAARVNAVLRRETRRGEGRSPTQQLHYGELVFYPEAPRVEIEGRAVALTATELRVLALLVQKPGRVVSRQEILDRIADEPEAQRSERVVDAHVKAIRKKLGGARDYIQTVRGVGYCFTAPERIAC